MATKLENTDLRPAFDVERIRQDFPILSEKVYGKPLVYLDNGASAQKPRAVIDAISAVYETEYANVHRGVHYMSQMATDSMEDAREKVRTFINAKDIREVIFVRGATEGINLVASSWGRKNLSAGDEIILSVMEHHSNIVPWQLIAEQTGALLKVVPISDNGSLDMDAYAEMVCAKTKIVAITHISNSLGTITPVDEIIRIAHEKDVPVLLDGCQAAPHMELDMQALDVDFYVFSGHNIYGPSGIGVLYGKETLLDMLPPYQGGGEMIEEVTFSKTTYAKLPHKFEAGTPNISGGIALGTAIDYLNEIGFDSISKYEKSLLDYATYKLLEIDGLKIYGESNQKTAVISFNIKSIHHYDLGTILDKLGIAVRTGHHCAQPIMDHFHIPGTIRASFSFYNTKEEIDIMVEAIKRAKLMLA